MISHSPLQGQISPLETVKTSGKIVLTISGIITYLMKSTSVTPSVSQGHFSIAMDLAVADLDHFHHLGEKIRLIMRMGYTAFAQTVTLVPFSTNCGNLFDHNPNIRSTVKKYLKLRLTFS